MKIYLVGGAVRDRLLGLEVKDRDWVVVGATPEVMFELGYTQLDAGFPVFNHPETGEEYALARRETKTGPGYKGFTVDASPEVTLEEDLARRDITINAIAEDPDGHLVDPFSGREDLDDGILRHITPAFVEDPVRLLRIARFTARLGRWGFRVAHTTHALMKEMAVSQDLKTLKPERFWAEMRQSFSSDQPWRFFEVLQRCGALAVLIPELSRAMGEPKGHCQQVLATPSDVLQRATLKTEDPRVRFAVLIWFALQQCDRPDELFERIRAGRAYRDLAMQLYTLGSLYINVHQRSSSSALTLLQRLKASQQPDNYRDFTAGAALLWPELSPGVELLLASAQAAVNTVSADTLLQQGLEGRALGDALRELQLNAIHSAWKGVVN